MIICRICGEWGEGERFDDWVRPTFTDWDKLQPGDGICQTCLFWFDEQSEELAQRVEKDKKQRMRNYSHFLVGNEWIPLSKSDKPRMKALLFRSPFPTLAVIADSGQKHIIFRARQNFPDATAGWVQFEEAAVYVRPSELAALLDTIEQLYVVFSKSEIKTGNYAQHRIRKFGLERWHDLESAISVKRGGGLFQLALFLAQKGECDDTRA